MLRHFVRLAFLARPARLSAALTLALAACSSSGGEVSDADLTFDAAAHDGARPADAGRDSSPVGAPDLAGGAAADLAMGASPDLAMPSGGSDGTPMRQACTGNYGNALSTAHGRLDGYLVSIVPPGGPKSCNGDTHHVHLQVMANGSVYDVAVDVEDNTGGAVYYLTKDLALRDGAWSEGWHPGETLSYTAEGWHAQDFTATPKTQLEADFMSELSTVNHISVFGTGYNANGMHLVHYENGTDGAIVTHPLASPAHYLLLHFANQSF